MTLTHQEDKIPYPNHTDPCAECEQELCEPGEYEERHIDGDCLQQVYESKAGHWYHSYCAPEIDTYQMLNTQEQH